MEEKNVQALAEKAAELKDKYHYNCCQAVAAVLAEDADLDQEMINMLTAGFGAGMGNMEGTCGALVGAVMVAGAKTGGNGSVPTARKIAEKFNEKSGAYRCKDLKGIDTGKVVCPCQQCVKNAVIAYYEVFGE